MKRFLKRALNLLICTCVICNLFVGVAFADSSSIIKVACVGDSITYGSQSTDAASRSYPAQLQEILGTQAYEVKNFGVSGKAVLFGKDRSYNTISQYTDSLAYEADIVIFMLGTNDINYYNATHFAGADSNFDATAFNTQFKENMKELINAYKNVSTTVYIANTPTSFRSTDENSKLAAIAELQAEVAQELGCELIDVRTFTSSMVNGTHYADGLHPNDTGYAQLAQYFYKEVFGGSIYNVTVNTDANINIHFGTQTLSSGSSGSVTFPAAPGSYSISASASGYSINYSDTVTVTNSNVTVNANIGEKFQNLAYGKTATASYTHNTFAANNITNGKNDNSNKDTTDRWNAGNTANTECWVYVDLGATKKFNTAVMYWNQKNCPSAYSIQISNDAETWTTATTDSCGLINSDSYTDYIRTVDLNSQVARYVRIYVPADSRASATQNWVSLVEFELYNKASGEVTVSKNLALNKDAKAHNVRRAGYEATKVTDGVNGLTSGNEFNSNRWVCNPENKDRWVYINLGSATEFNRTVLYFNYNNCPNEYKIQTCNSVDEDGNGNWTTVATQTVSIAANSKTTSEYIITTDFETVTAKYIRMLVPQGVVNNGADYFVSVIEFEVYKVTTLNATEKYTENIALKGTGICDTPDEAWYNGSLGLLDRAASNLNNGKINTSTDQPWGYSNRGTNSNKFPSTDKDGVDFAWAGIEFDGLYKFNQVKIYWGTNEYGNCSNKRLEYSVDGKTWVDITYALSSENTVDSSKKTTLETYNLDNAVKAKYVRVYMENCSSPYPPNIWEMEIYGQKDFVMLGAQTKLQDDGTDEYKLRFVTAINTDYFTVDGNKVTAKDIKKLGTLLVRADSGITDITLDNTDSAIKNLSTTYLCNTSSSTNKVYTFTATITNIGSDKLDTEYTARAYMLMNDGTVIYTDSVTRCVNDDPTV